jgi:hypothetical protein
MSEATKAPEPAKSNPNESLAKKLSTVTGAKVTPGQHGFDVVYVRNDETHSTTIFYRAGLPHSEYVVDVRHWQNMIDRG